MSRRNQALLARACAPFLGLIWLIIIACASAADAAVDPVSVQSITECLLGNLSQGPIDAFVKLFVPSGVSQAGGLLVTVASYYERICFGLAISLVVLRFVVAEARDPIDGALSRLFSTALGPSLLFAAGLFLTSSLAGGTSNVIDPMLTKAESFGTTMASKYMVVNNNAKVSSALNLAAGLDKGDIGGILKAGICSSEAVIFGAPPVSTGTGFDKIIAFATNLVKGVQAISNGPIGLFIIAVTYFVKTVVALFLLYTIVKVAYEVFVIFLIKMIVIPLGLVFFGFGQIEIFSFLKDAYIRFIVYTLARVLMLSLLLPLFFGIMLSALVIGTQAAMLGVTGGVAGQAIGSLVDVFVDLAGVVLLNFFINSYKDFYEPFVVGLGTAGATGAGLGQAVSAGMSPVTAALSQAAKTISSAVAGFATGGPGGAVVGAIGSGTGAGKGSESGAPPAPSPSVPPPDAAPPQAPGKGDGAAVPPPLSKV